MPEGPPPSGYVQPELCTECGMPPPGSGAKRCAHCGHALDCHSPWRLMSNALIHLFYAARCEPPLPAVPAAADGSARPHYVPGGLGGVTYAQALAWLPTFRPYRSSSALPWRAFIDQCYLVTHVVSRLLTGL